ncbi:MAG: polyprenyl diphosphate synthase [Candidatus Levyibacteriota bacterium]
MDNQKIPQHVAFIMDGNRRWARGKGLPTLLGHARGYKRIERIVDYADMLGIKYTTFWAFSTDNWNRGHKEVAYLMELFRELLGGKMIKKLLAKGRKITILGELDPFPKDIQDTTRKLIEDSKDNTGIHINIALNYGGRAEIVRAVKNVISDRINSTDITSDLLSHYFYTKYQPDPDLIIRTGGEQRLSGYLLWQSVHSELYFTDTFWPDFDEQAFDKALEEYKRRERRFGR